MDASEFLNSAIELLNGNREIDSRNSASRSFYYMFHTCKDIVDKLPSQAIGNSHERVINTLLEHNDQKYKTLGNLLSQSKSIRVKADYKLAEPFHIGKAKLLTLHAAKMNEQVSKL